MLTIHTIVWCREGKKKKERKINSYLYDVAVKGNISTLAGKRHHAPYFDTGKHALSPEPFQILQRPTQQSCTSRFLTEGDPDVICIYPLKLGSSNAKCLPCACFNIADEEMFEVTWYFVVQWEFVSIYIGPYMHRGCCTCWLCRKGTPKYITSHWHF